jgi:FKBP-type peptidyl-prolyl cis-trans isomerase FkpA
LSFKLKGIEVKKIVLPFSLLFVMFAGLHCVKNSTCTPKTPASEAAQMQAYCAGNGITPAVHSSGLFYQILSPGSGATATVNSRVVITYTGKLLDGSIFDQRTTPNNTQASGPEGPWALSQLIEGWRTGIPLIQKGGHILLVVPSSMGYLCSDYGIIPGNSILFFDITLVDVL